MVEGNQQEVSVFRSVFRVRVRPLFLFPSLPSLSLSTSPLGRYHTSRGHHTYSA